MSDEPQSKRFKEQEPVDGTDRFKRNQALWIQRGREVNMYAAVKFQLEERVKLLERVCLSMEYSEDYNAHTATRQEIAQIKCTLADQEREYHIKKFAFDVALRELDFGKYECDRAVKGWTTEHYWEYVGRHNGGVQVHM